MRAREGRSSDDSRRSAQRGSAKKPAQDNSCQAKEEGKITEETEKPVEEKSEKGLNG